MPNYVNTISYTLVSLRYSCYNRNSLAIMYVAAIFTVMSIQLTGMPVHHRCRHFQLVQTILQGMGLVSRLEE